MRYNADPPIPTNTTMTSAIQNGIERPPSPATLRLASLGYASAISPTPSPSESAISFGSSGNASKSSVVPSLSLSI